MATIQETQKILAELREQSNTAVKRIRQTITALELELDEKAPNMLAITNLQEAIKTDVTSLAVAASIKNTYNYFAEKN